MKRYLLWGLTALGLVALTPTGSKADDGFRICVNPCYQQVRHITTVETTMATIVSRTNTEGTDTIIGTITVVPTTGIEGL
jgi:hypothetical protein